MKQRKITYLLKAVAIALGLLGIAFFGSAFVYAFIYKPDYQEIVPGYLRENVVFIMITGVICYVILYFFWRIITEIGNDNSFSMENVKNFNNMAFCGLLIIIEYIIRIIIWLIKDNLNLVALSYTLLKIFVFIIYIILCIAMAKLVHNAYDIKTENDLTI